MPEGEHVVFYCGGYGEFDLICSRVCRSLKDVWPDSETVFVTPYLNPSQQQRIRELLENRLYDSSVYPPLENVHPRFAILKRNEWMIEKADLVFAYVNVSYGGAAKGFAYAKQKGKTVINLADSSEIFRK